MENVVAVRGQPLNTRNTDKLLPLRVVAPKKRETAAAALLPSEGREGGGRREGGNTGRGIFAPPRFEKCAAKMGSCQLY